MKIRAGLSFSNIGLAGAWAVFLLPVSGRYQGIMAGLSVFAKVDWSWFLLPMEVQ